MAIRFRFRSSPDFDSVDIEGKPLITVRDLKRKIIQNKNMNICQDFDLLLSDAVSNKEYYDENYQIPGGSSVIIKRVPKGTLHSNVTCSGELPENARVKEASAVKSFFPANLDSFDFDDFGAELCPIPEPITSASDLDAGKKLHLVINETTDEVPRCFEMPSVGNQKPEASGVSEAIPRGPLYMDKNEGIALMKLKPGVGEFAKPKMVVTSTPQDIKNVTLPVELKCSLCNSFFEDAVMIPCCQHSFCEKCINVVLSGTGKCPKCLSTKYKSKDLLPNVSLRQAIKRFLESQILIRSSEDAFGYASDGESGIHVKEMSCAMSIQQREVSHSPGTTGRGSNQIANVTSGKSSFSPKFRQIDGENYGSKYPVFLEKQHEDSVADFQGENQPMLQEVSIIKKKRALHVHTGGLGRGYTDKERYRKANRTCYMCGSPDHFMRECPAALSPHPMLQTGNAILPGAMPDYSFPYWNRAPFPQFRPFVNPYGISFNSTMVLPPTYAVPTYVPYGGMTTYGNFASMGGAASMIRPRAEWHPGLSDSQERIVHEKGQKLSHDSLMREQCFDSGEEDEYIKRHHSSKAERSYVPKFHQVREDSVTHSKDSFTERSRRKRWYYNHFDDEFERSSSEVEDRPTSSNRHSREWHKHHHRNSKSHDGGRERAAGDSSHSLHQSTKAKDVKRKDRPDVIRDRRKHHSQLGSGLEPSSSSDKKTQERERDSSYCSKHSRHNSRSTDNEASHERWQMVNRSDEDLEVDYLNHKRKRHY